jgi:hypothetical protein
MLPDIELEIDLIRIAIFGCSLSRVLLSVVCVLLRLTAFLIPLRPVLVLNVVLSSGSNLSENSGLRSGVTSRDLLRTSGIGLRIIGTGGIVERGFMLETVWRKKSSLGCALYALVILVVL